MKCILYLSSTLTSSITVLHGALFSALSMHETEKPPYAFYRSRNYKLSFVMLHEEISKAETKTRSSRSKQIFLREGKNLSSGRFWADSESHLSRAAPASFELRYNTPLLAGLASSLRCTVLDPGHSNCL